MSKTTSEELDQAQAAISAVMSGHRATFQEDNVIYGNDLTSCCCRIRVRINDEQGRTSENTFQRTPQKKSKTAEKLEMNRK